MLLLLFVLLLWLLLRPSLLLLLLLLIIIPGLILLSLSPMSLLLLLLPLLQVPPIAVSILLLLPLLLLMMMMVAVSILQMLGLLRLPSIRVAESSTCCQSRGSSSIRMHVTHMVFCVIPCSNSPQHTVHTHHLTYVPKVDRVSTYGKKKTHGERNEARILGKTFMKVSYHTLLYPTNECDMLR